MLNKVKFLAVSLLLGSANAMGQMKFKHPIVQASANVVDLEVRNDNDYRGHIYVGSKFEEAEIIYDTMQQNTLIVGQEVEGQNIPNFYNALESESAVKATYADEEFNDQ